MVPAPPNFSPPPPLQLPAVELAAALRAGDLRAVDVLEACLQRIGAHNPELAALVRMNAPAARRAAAAADRQRAQGKPLGPFHGVPTAIKDHHFQRGRRVGMGSRAFSFVWSPFDDIVVKRLRAAGFILVGHTAMSELGVLPITEPPGHPPTRNPWDTGRTPGGSSGGAAVAVAAGLLPIAPGSDGAGSIRIPAALNGLVGHKPSRGLVADGAERIDTFGLTAVGPLARCTRDAAALLDVLANTGDRHQKALHSPPSRLRVGLVLRPPFGDIDPRLSAAAAGVADQLRALGHTVEEREPPAGHLSEFVPIYQHLIGRIPVFTPGRLGPFVRHFWEQGRKVPAADAEALLAALRARGATLMEGLDVLVSPTTGCLTPAVGAFSALPPEEVFAAVTPLGIFTALGNLTGLPAISVPYGLIDGMPVGVQIMGQHGRDADLLALAAQLGA